MESPTNFWLNFGCHHLRLSGKSRPAGDHFLRSFNYLYSNSWRMERFFWFSGWNGRYSRLQVSCTLWHQRSGPQWNQNVAQRINWRSGILIFHLLERETISRIPDSWNGFCGQNIAGARLQSPLQIHQRASEVHPYSHSSTPWKLPDIHLSLSSNPWWTYERRFLLNWMTSFPPLHQRMNWPSLSISMSKWGMMLQRGVQW